MLKDEYKAIYDRIQPSRSLEAETEAQIMAHFDGKKLVKPISRTAVIAIALAVLLVGTAIAATPARRRRPRWFGMQGRCPTQASP